MYCLFAHTDMNIARVHARIIIVFICKTTIFLYGSERHDTFFDLQILFIKKCCNFASAMSFKTMYLYIRNGTNQLSIINDVFNVFKVRICSSDRL